MIPKDIKQQIKDKFDELNHDVTDDWGGYEFWDNGAIFGYQLATDGREELEAEKDGLNRVISKMFADRVDDGLTIERLKLERDKFEGGDELKAKKIQELEAWKESAMIVMSPVQEIGQAMNLKLGESILEKVVPYITALQSSKEELEKDRLDMRKFITALQSSLKEKEKECEELKQKADYWGEQWILANDHYKELKAENKTLQDAFDNNLKEFMLLGTHAKDLEKENERLKEVLRKIKVHFGDGASKNPYIKPVIEIINNNS